MTEMVRLIAPVGCDECSHGQVRYKVHDDGTVTVPLEAVEPLCRVGGFYRPPADHPPERAHPAEPAQT